MPFSRRLFLLAPLALSLALTACATNPVTGKTDFVLISEADEIEIGRKNHAAIVGQYGVYAAPRLSDYINQLGQRLARASHRSHLDYTFTLLDSPEVNAFALPGGYIYVTRGILAYMNSEEELAGVLGHEIGHVTARHGVRQQSATFGAAILIDILNKATGNAAEDLFNTAGAAWTSGYGRQHELEADRLGAEYLARTGYDPEKMLDVIGILKDREAFEIARAKAEGREAQNYHGLFASHPDNDKRLREVIKAAHQYKSDNTRRPAREDFLRKLSGLPYGQSEAQGIVRGSRFYHKALNLTLAAPDGWRLINEPTRLLALADDRSALFMLHAETRKPDERAVQMLWRKFPNAFSVRAIDEHIQIGEVASHPALDGAPALVGAVVHQGNAFVAAAFGRALPHQQFAEILQSMRALKRGEQSLARGNKLRLIRASATTRIDKLAEEVVRATRPDCKTGNDCREHFESTAAELRLLNALYPNGEPVPGDLIKIIR